MSSTSFLFGSALAAITSLPALGAVWNPDPSVGNVEQHCRLYEIGRQYADANFDPDANLVSVSPTGNAPLPNKAKHSYRESAIYAYGLLLTGDPSDRARAQELLKRVIAVQDTRPDSPTYGVYLWYTDQNWAKVQNPDLNAVEFIGVVLADIIDLDRRRPMLDPDLRREVEASCRLAVEAAIRRNVDTNYTNISLLSVALTAAGAKFWKMPDAERFAQSKLDTVLTMAQGGVVYEYLCPTYGAVDFQGAYLARKFSFSDAFAAQADAMIDHLWKEIAAAYHPPTYQLGGPFGRAYGDDMLTYSAGLKYFLYLGLGGAYPIPDADPRRGVDQCGLLLAADLPISARPEFKLPVPAWRQFNAIGGGLWPERRLSQYRGHNFILGTVEFQDEWPQKRNLVAYWRSDAPPPDGFRVGMCIDESNETLPKDFSYSQLHFYSRQEKGAALVAMVGPAKIPDQGGSSLVFDHGAAIGEGKAAAPLSIKDGAITAYLYPVSSGAVTFENQVDAVHHVIRVTRPWSSADAIGSLRVLAYLIVFRPTGEPPPSVSALALTTHDYGISASARVDGTDLTVSFTN